MEYILRYDVKINEIHINLVCLLNCLNMEEHNDFIHQNIEICSYICDTKENNNNTCIFP